MLNRRDLNKKIIFTTHAKERIKQRGLSEQWVLDIIRNHDISLGKRQDGTEELRKERGGTYYYAVIEHRKSVVLVITTGEAEK